MRELDERTPGIFLEPEVITGVQQSVRPAILLIVLEINGPANGKIDRRRGSDVDLS